MRKQSSNSCSSLRPPESWRSHPKASSYPCAELWSGDGCLEVWARNRRSNRRWWLMLRRGGRASAPLPGTGARPQRQDWADEATDRASWRVRRDEFVTWCAGRCDCALAAIGAEKCLSWLAHCMCLHTTLCALGPRTLKRGASSPPARGLPQRRTCRSQAAPPASHAGPAVQGGHIDVLRRPLLHRLFRRCPHRRYSRLPLRRRSRRFGVAAAGRSALADGPSCVASSISAFAEVSCGRSMMGAYGRMLEC